MAYEASDRCRAPRGHPLLGRAPEHPDPGVLVAALAGVLAVVGLLAVMPAPAVAGTYSYDTGTFAYDAPARSSPPRSVAAGARGSPERPGVASWVEHAAQRTTERGRRTTTTRRRAFSSDR